MGTGGATVAPFILDSKFLTSHSKISNLHLGAQHNFFELSGGPTILALGLDFFKQKYTVDYGDYYLFGSGFSTQPALPSFPIGGNYGQVPLGMDRDNWAAYAEWFVPITKTLEATASLRYDHYDKTGSSWVFATDLESRHRSLRSTAGCRPGQHVQQDHLQGFGALAADQGIPGAWLMGHGLPGARHDRHRGHVGVRRLHAGLVCLPVSWHRRLSARQRAVRPAGRSKRSFPATTG